MTYYNTPHEVKDHAKLQNMIDALESGKSLPPVVVCGGNALTGSHRLVAWYRCEMRPETVEVSEADYVAAMEQIGLDPVYDEIYDYNEFCDALYRVTSDAQIKAALEDQRG